MHQWVNFLSRSGLFRDDIEILCGLRLSTTVKIILFNKFKILNSLKSCVNMCTWKWVKIQDFTL